MSEHASLTWLLSPSAASGRAVPRDICYSRTGELLLWGPALWDPRAPRRIHRFDVFAENCGGSIFHPAGLEAILNSEVGPCLAPYTRTACLLSAFHLITCHGRTNAKHCRSPCFSTAPWHDRQS